MSYYNLTILKTAAKKSFLHIVWLVALIGIPIVFYQSELTPILKSLLFIVLLVSLWLIYFLCCLAFHRLSMRNELNRLGYLVKDDLEKGKEVGTFFEVA